jgi:hypothetical protein
LLAACEPTQSPDEVCIKSHIEQELVPIPITTYNSTTGSVEMTTQMMWQDDEICDESHTLTPSEKQQWIKEHQ